MEVDGLTEFQRDLLEMAQVKAPKEAPKLMRKIGNKARLKVVKTARSMNLKKTGNYLKRFKRGKVFKGKNGEWVVRVINSAPHAHLIEYGHRQVLNPPKKNGERGVEPGRDIGEQIGFVKGQFPMDKGMREFEQSGEVEKVVLDWLDDLLESGNL